MEKFKQSPRYNEQRRPPFNENAMTLFHASNLPMGHPDRKVTRFTYDKATDSYIPISILTDDSKLNIHDFEYVDRIN